MIDHIERMVVAISQIDVLNTGTASPTLSIAVDPLSGFNVLSQQPPSSSDSKRRQEIPQSTTLPAGDTAPLVIVPITGNELRLVFELTGNCLDTLPSTHHTQSQSLPQLSSEPPSDPAASAPPLPPRPQHSLSALSKQPQPQPQKQERSIENQPCIYFTVARSEQDISELCTDTSSPRQQGYLSPVLLRRHDVVDSSPRIYKWDWSYPISDGSVTDGTASTGYKAVFASSTIASCQQTRKTNPYLPLLVIYQARRLKMPPQVSVSHYLRFKYPPSPMFATGDGYLPQRNKIPRFGANSHPLETAITPYQCSPIHRSRNCQYQTPAPHLLPFCLGQAET
ncbi:hypothetical protein BG004_003165 [Podila humilis]|nr:hypothetical protein BG004_003165 [Podila humilis]